MVLTTVGYGSTAHSTAVGKVWGSGGASWFKTLLVMVPQLPLSRLERYEPVKSKICTCIEFHNKIRSIFDCGRYNKS